MTYKDAECSQNLLDQLIDLKTALPEDVLLGEFEQRLDDAIETATTHRDLMMESYGITQQSMVVDDPELLNMLGIEVVETDVEGNETEVIDGGVVEETA